MPSPPSPTFADNPDSRRAALYADRGEASYPVLFVPGWRRMRSDAFLITALLLVCGLSAYVGIAAPLGSFAHDTFFFLDNAYRVTQGQVPHRDFSSAWGPIMFLIHASGLVLSGMRPAGIGYANALFGALIALWACQIVRTRWSSASTYALGVYTALLIAAPFPIGFHPFDFGYAMIYNRYGYALFGIVMIECAVNASPGPAWNRRSTGGAISTGIAIGILLFLKISYAVVAIPFAGVLMLSNRGGRMRRFIGLSGGLAIVTVLVVCYLRFDVFDMLQDMATAAVARQMYRRPLLPLNAVDSIQNIMILLFAAGLLWQARTATAHDRTARFQGALFALLTIVAGYLLLITNQQTDTFPLNGYAAVVLVTTYGPSGTGKLPAWLGFKSRLTKAMLLTVCFLPLVMENGVSLAAAALERQWPGRTDVISLPSPERDADLVFRLAWGKRGTETIGAEYVEALNDGLALLRRHSGDRDGVLAFDEFNPFNYLLDRPSPRGGFAAAAYNYMFCDAAHPTAERFFGDAPFVMVRKYKTGGTDIMERDNILGLMRNYGAALRSHFVVIEETEHWTLWRRIDAPGAWTGG